MKHGYDMSYCQRNVPYDKSDAEFAIIRAGYGCNATHVDDMFETHYNGYKSKGTPVGAYWYSYAKTPAEAEQEAKVCIDTLKGKQFEYPIFYDVEERSQFALGKAKVSAIIRAFLSTVERAGYFVGLYSSSSALYSYVENDIKTRYTIWVAHWKVDKPSYTGDYGVWQTGYVSKFGISDNSYIDYPTIIKEKQLNGFGKPTSEVKHLIAGQKLTLVDEPLYVSSTTSTPATNVNGDYYVFDGKIYKGRIRITNSLSNCSRLPYRKYVTGWIDVDKSYIS